MTKLKNILIQITMLEEAIPLMKEFNFKKILTDSSSLLFDLYKTKLNNTDLYLVIAKSHKKYKVPSVGYPLASLIAWEATNLLAPNLILNLGTAGGVKSKGAKIGDVYLAKKASYHDRNFHPTKITFKKYSCGDFSTFFKEEWANKLGIKKGIVSSGNRMLLIKEDDMQLKKNHAVIKDMEAAPIAEIAELKKIPIIILKAITDLIDIEHCSQKQFDKNFSLAVNQLTNKAKKLISLLIH